MTAVINPLGKPSSELPTIDDFARGEAAPSVGGSYFMAIDPAVFGPIDAVKEKSDQFIDAVRSVKNRPGESIRIPGEKGYHSIEERHDDVEVLETHWTPFFETIAGKLGLSEAEIRQDFNNQQL